MILTDFHVHSNNSSDALDSMRDMALAAREAGVEIMCFTDHCDIDAYPTGKFNPDCFDIWAPMLAEYRALMNDCPQGLDVRLGIELGEGNHAKELADKIAGQQELDFILGSTHSLRDTVDFCELQYNSEEHCAQLLHDYLSELYELAGLDSFDCIGHIGYTCRYMIRAGYTITVEDKRFEEQVDMLLRQLVERGRGIELNCSGLRRPEVGRALPGVPILRRYRELGGEIITIGSDAHQTADVGQHIKSGMELLRELSYRYITVYKKRIPEFIAI